NQTLLVFDSLYAVTSGCADTLNREPRCCLPGRRVTMKPTRHAHIRDCAATFHCSPALPAISNNARPPITNPNSTGWIEYAELLTSPPTFTNPSSENGSMTRAAISEEAVRVNAKRSELSPDCFEQTFSPRTSAISNR